MEFSILLVMVLFGCGELFGGQTSDNANTAATAVVEPAGSYVVIGALEDQEGVLRAQIRVMRPEVLPLRIVFVPHWKYLDDARILRLHVPTGYGSVMFTHLPSRTVYIDKNFYSGEKWLGHWIAHELGHLATNSIREEDAEKVARGYRKRLKMD
jgi:hypothetical protein